MTPGPHASLQLPFFLQGTFSSVQQKTRKEGLRCGELYGKDGSFPVPLRMLEVPLGDVVLTHEGADLQHERSAWRLHMVSHVMSGLSEALEGQNPFPARDAYEARFLDTSWGALYFATSAMVPVSAERTALRLLAVLRFWEPLQGARYLFKTLGAPLTLEDLMGAACDWAMDAWCPGGETSVRERLATAAERMARATRDDCIEAILRQMPHALSFARNLKHRDVVADPAFQRERLAELPPPAFERVSGACTSDLLALLYSWDRQSGRQ
ncbi:hypothetical protein CYFUS_009641 [Cystobacter fuscus]|uniref:Uncharacterized protein n=1 Tax=Cystobacter fuscus TaxID=43 RepID=A0A250JJU8_9BACT|nr:hypothetical protein [Cystobacter fuscus]ATB44159.1 hypothetical protein CYFUS_009641 [Cystobacter fuscus]